jgi:hypothetical protein
MGWAFDWGWQLEQAVDAMPPSKRVVSGVPWQVWQKERSCLAVSP